MRYDRTRYQERWAMERKAQAVRRALGLTQTQVLDPWLLAEAIHAHVFYPEDLVHPDLAVRAGNVDWDGFAFVFPGEKHLMVVLNPARPERRQCATLLEELSHHILGHQPSRIYADADTGLLMRDFNRAQEDEAFDFGSVVLLPKELIQQHVKVARGSAQQLADMCGCSIDLVHMRIKRCRLWNRYLAYAS